MTIILAIDGNSLTHRAYHGFKGRDGQMGRINSFNQPVWAVQGLIGTIGRIVEKTGATHVVVAFDDINSSERKTEKPDYKAGRSKKDDHLVSQLALAPEVLRAYGINVCVPKGLEADDVMSDTARLAKSLGAKCIIATSDRDSYSLVDDNTSIFSLMTGGIDQAKIVNGEYLQTRYGINAGSYLLYAALRGDSSDNLPGIKGVGEIGAAKIVNEVSDITALKAELSKQTPFEGRLPAALLSKLNNDEALAVIELNTRMMSARTTEMSQEFITALPLKFEDVAAANAKYDLKISSNASNAFLSTARSASSSSSEAPAPAPVPNGVTMTAEVSAYTLTPSRESTLDSLKDMVNLLGLSAQSPASSGADETEATDANVATEALNPVVTPASTPKSSPAESSGSSFRFPAGGLPPNPKPEQSTLF